VKTQQEPKVLDEIHDQWKNLWRDTLDDKVNSEKIADKDYALLFVQQGTVVKSSREPELNYQQILQKHQETGVVTSPVNPEVGGWGKFARTAINTRKKSKIDNAKPVPRHKVNRQQKKNGRGWLHQTPIV
jgi:hypothetical protein